ncbi:MAG: ATP-binding protein [Elainellaceae cyanobacterium]
MMRSFRVRIALLSTALAGAALMGFGGVAWRSIYGAKISRVDARLDSQLQRFARRPPPPSFWQAGPANIPRQLDGNADAVALQVYDSNGNLLYRSDNWPTAATLDWDRRGHPPRHREPQFDRRRPPRPGRPTQRVEQIRGYRTVTRRADDGRWRIGAAELPAGTIAIAVSLASIDQEMAVIRTIFLIAIPGTLLLVAGGAWGVSSRALRPIQQLTEAIQQITVAGLDQRVSAEATDVEFAALIQVFNQMLARLARSFKQASRFSADAAHELKTPLAILQGELEQTLQQAEPGSEQQQQLSSLLDEVRRLGSIVRKLLLLSLADAGQMALYKVPIDLSALVAVMVEDVELLAPHLRVEADVAPQLSVQGDRDLLTQVLQNLISNAIKYNMPDGWVRIEARRQPDAIQVSITNASRGIPEGDRDRIFDRFYRGDPARNRRVEGLGLGLSLSREIVHAHGGRLDLALSLGDQTTFLLTLPTAV